MITRLKKLNDYLLVKYCQLAGFYLPLKIQKLMKNVPGTPIIPSNGIATKGISAYLY